MVEKADMKPSYILCLTSMNGEYVFRTLSVSGWHSLKTGRIIDGEISGGLPVSIPKFRVLLLGESYARCCSLSEG